MAVIIGKVLNLRKQEYPSTGKLMSTKLYMAVTSDLLTNISLAVTFI